MIKEIKGFHGEYRWLSNFWPAEVVLVNDSFPTAEHAYQASKCYLPGDYLLILMAKTPGEAKKLGRKVKIRDDWESIKLQIMESVVRYKFTKNKDLGKKLVETGDAYIEETNNWGDCYYGVCNGKGENHLGKILMKVRSELAVQP